MIKKNFTSSFYLLLILFTANTSAQTNLFSDEKVISDMADGAYSTIAADLDGDYDEDLLLAYFDKIVWYENDGSGNFATEQVIGAETDWIISVYAADLDNDGDLDVLSASFWEDQIAWYENDGSGNFGVQQIITTTADEAMSVYAADLDNDGDLDVLSASRADNKLAWYENSGNAIFDVAQIISTDASGASCVYASDLDNDGDLDVLSASVYDNKIAWYENQGSDNFGTQQIISTDASGAGFVYTADLDGDGDVDVLSASANDDKIAWYENEGNANFGTEQIISLTADVARTVYTADLDNDNDLDILSASAYDDKVAWYENDGNANFGTEQIISTTANGVYSVFAADLDGDYDIDVVSASQIDNKIAWYENKLLEYSEPPLANPIAAFETAPATQNDIDTLYVCGGQEISFNNLSENSTNFYWDFGDGNSSLQANPTHAYDNAGTYHVTLTVENYGEAPSLECEADAGEQAIFIDGAGFAIYDYNMSANYEQIYIGYNDEGESIAVTNDVYEFFANEDIEEIAAVNYAVESIELNSSFLADLEEQATNNNCLDIDIYNRCSILHVYINLFYDVDYEGYLITFQGFGVPPNSTFNYPIAYIDGSMGGGIILDTEIIFYLSDNNGEAFAFGDTITVCKNNTENQGACCKTFIIPDGPPTINPLAAPTQAFRMPNEEEENEDETAENVATLVVVVSPNEAADIECISPICLNNSETYTTSVICDTYEWEIEGGIIASGQGTPNITVFWTEAPQGIISLTTDCPENDCGPSIAFVPIIAPNAELSGETIVCTNEQLSYAAPFLGNGTSYNWTISPPQAGEIITGQNSNIASVKWKNQDATLHLDYQNTLLDCGGTAELDIFVLPTFSINSSAGVCVGSESSITMDAAESFDWTVTGGTIVFGQNTDSIVVAWNEVGFATVSATAIEDSIFCNETTERMVKVESLPASPSIDGPTLICPEDTHVYVASPLESGTTFVWSVVGGTIILGENTNMITVAWGNSGPYEVSVERKDMTGLQCESLPATLNVYALGEDDLSISGENLLCPNNTFTYVASPSLPYLEYEWSIEPPSAGIITQGQGNSLVNIFWTGDLEGQSAVLSVGSCGENGDYTINFAEFPRPSILQGDTLCSDNIVEINVVDSLGITYTQHIWSNEEDSIISTAPSIFLNPEEEGLYSVMVSSGAGCAEELSFYVKQYTSPVANVSSLFSTICLENPYNVPMWAIDGTNYEFEWLQDGNAIPDSDNKYYTHNYTLDTVVFDYQVLVTDTSSSCQTLSEPFTIEQMFCPPDTTSGVADTTITPPSFSPCSPISTEHIVAFDLEVNPFCPDVTVTNLSEGDYLGFLLYWGDVVAEDFSTTTVATHDYGDGVESLDIYKISLLGIFLHPTTGDTCYNIANQIHEVPLVARFDVTKACLNETWVFQDRSYYLPETSITEWTWDFGDGSPIISGTQTEEHTYTEAGVYTVTMNVTNGYCTVTTSEEITVSALPTADFTISDGLCINNIIEFTPNNLEWDTYEWDFGNGETSEAAEPITYYNSAGIYEISLAVSDEKKCASDTIFQTIEIIAAPEANSITASDTLLCAGETATLTAPEGETFLWSNGETTSSITVSTSGKYWVKVILENGCDYNSEPVLITFQPLPNATFFPNTDTLRFCNTPDGATIQVPFVPHATYTWSPSLNIDTNVRTVTTNGNWAVTVTDTLSGCSNSNEITTIKMYAPNTPTIAADQIAICEGDTAQISVTSSNNNVAEWLWTTGESGQQIEVTHTDNYGVVAISDFGCKSDTSALAFVEAVAFPDISVFPSGCYDVCEGDSIILPPNDAVTYTWYFNNEPLGIVGNSILPAESGEYWVSMANSLGCADSTDILYLNLISDCYTTLAAELYEFNGKTIASGNDLYWTSLSEKNCAFYTLSWSENGVQFQDIAKIDGNGTSNTLKTYQFLHKTQTTTSYYRLSQTDFDGETKDLGHLLLHRTTQAAMIQVFPNPSSGMIKVKCTVEEEAVLDLNLYSATGSLIWHRKMPAHTQSTDIDISDLPNGLYILQAKGKVNTQTQRIVKQ